MCGSQPHPGSAAISNPAPEPTPAALPTPLFDAHCHPTDNMHCAGLITSMHATQLVLMATRAHDQHLVAQLADAHGARVVPAFGWHPWFAHHLYDDTTGDAPDEKLAHYAHVLGLATPLAEDDRLFVLGLPEPCALSGFLAQTAARLRRYPHAIVGEIGLDRAFRLPVHHTSTPSSDLEAPTPGTRAGRRLSPYRVSIAHQTAVLTAQLRLAAAHRRPVSVHGVQAHGLLYDALAALWRGHSVSGRSRRQKTSARDEAAASDAETASEDPFPPKICLHSFSGPRDVALRYTHTSVPCEIFFSFSAAVNLGGAPASAEKFAAVVAAVPDDRILAESDLDAAGPRMDTELARIYSAICAAKSWTLDNGVPRIKQNYENFIRVDGRVD